MGKDNQKLTVFIKKFVTLSNSDLVNHCITKSKMKLK